MKKPELLSPAGTYEGFLAAVNAGADAVYFGGEKYSARAYAENINAEQAKKAITFARLNGVKTYLTVNTLTTEKELDALPEFLESYVNAGLNGVIVQDFGSLKVIADNFPSLALHASTQMAVSGVYSAKLAKRLGCERVVPARELSLKELEKIRTEADIEVEVFIHGAMCYAYSGLCLFSAMIGGRSGNRGRCAQSCRLPYSSENKKEAYYLSMKDLSSLDNLPFLIEAGMDSFKIEGRMKKSEYTAGVTAMYRKYIDRYFNDPKGYEVDKKDRRYLSSLYQRTQVMTGYLYRHNGKELVTMGAPGYNKSDDIILSEIRKRYIENTKKIPVNIYCTMMSGKPLSVSCESKDTVYTEEGDIVERAKKRPLSKEDLVKQLSKTGDTFFKAESISVNIDESGVFAAISSINDTRRKALAGLERKLIE